MILRYYTYTYMPHEALIPAARWLLAYWARHGMRVALNNFIHTYFTICGARGFATDTQGHSAVMTTGHDVGFRFQRLYNAAIFVFTAFLATAASREPRGAYSIFVIDAISSDD